MIKLRRKNVRSNNGFTLIEVILTVAILAFGIVSIYEALFVSVDAYGYYTHYLDTQDWINEKVWEVQDELINSRVLDTDPTSGQIVRGHKTFDWAMTVKQLDELQGLYEIDITLSWKEGNKRVSTNRTAYLLPPELRVYDKEGSA